MDTDHAEQGRACYARRAWSEAYVALTRADQLAPLSAEDLEQLTAAAYLVGRDEEFQRLHERLHRMYVGLLSE